MTGLVPYTTRILIAAAALSVACSQDEAPTTPGPAPKTVIEDSLVFQRADSTIVTMGTTPIVCCGIYDPSFVNEHALEIVMFDQATQRPTWRILLLTDHAQAGATTTLPTTFVSPSKAPYVSLFATDYPNQVNSDQSASVGTIIVHSFSCTPTSISIDFNIDAVLASEFAVGTPMRAKGRFRAILPAQSCS